MKKTALITILALIYFGAEAQSVKGTFQLGFGGLPIIYPDNSAAMGYSLRANIGYFPIDRLSIGITPFAGKVQDMQSIGANIYFRYYIINQRFALFADGGGGIGNLTYEFSPQYNGLMSSFNIGPGIHYLFKSRSENKLAIEFLLQYARLQNINYPENTVTGNTLIPTLGIQYFMNR